MIELAIGAFDDPHVAAPKIQVNPADKLDFFDGLSQLPVRPDSEAPSSFRTLVSNQHPDHDTDRWPPEASP